jgi:hypothetical protein
MSARVLLLGFDPATVPGVDTNMVNYAIAIGQAKFDAERITTENCFVRPDESARAQIIEQLKANRYEVIVIGGGLRKPEALLQMFEEVVNLVRVYAPDAAIAFNSNPTDSADAAMRWLGRTI